MNASTNRDAAMEALARARQLTAERSLLRASRVLRKATELCPGLEGLEEARRALEAAQAADEPRTSSQAAVECLSLIHI